MDELISVIMPVFNRDQYLAQAISSVLRQSYTHWELLVIDDGSTDDSLLVAEKFAKQDDRIRVFKNGSNKGINYSRNKGVLEAQGQVIALLDSDDVAEEERFQKQLLEIMKGSDLVGSNVTFIDANGKPLGQDCIALGNDEIKNKMRHTLPLLNPTLMVRKAVFLKVGGYRLPFAEDYDFFLRAMTLGFHAENIDVPLVRMRMHLGNVGVMNVGYQRRLTELAWRLYQEREVLGYETTEWQEEVASLSRNSNWFEKRGAYYYRKAYVFKRQWFRCFAYMILAVVFWPANALRVMRRFV